ncbi:MAG: phage tail protein I [Calditrichia bacterium]
MQKSETQKIIFQTPEQWRSGLFYKLAELSGGGITVGFMPEFSPEFLQIPGLEDNSAIAAAGCNRFFFLNNQTCRLFEFDLKNGFSSRIGGIGGCGDQSARFGEIRRLRVYQSTLWILDAGNQRLQGFSLENYQIKYQISTSPDPVDFALSATGELYLLENNPPQIRRFDAHGEHPATFGQSELLQPVAVAVSRSSGRIFVLDPTKAGFLVFSPEGNYSGLRGDFTPLGSNFKPILLESGAQGTLFLYDDYSRQIHQFDEDGSHLGIIKDFAEDVSSITVDAEGNLYAVTPRGLAIFTLGQSAQQETGYYYSKTLDSGLPDCRWHRLRLEAELPENTRLEVYYYISGNEILKNNIDSLIKETSLSVQERAQEIDNQVSWSGPQVNPPDMLFREGSGRYMWLKLALSSADPQKHPLIRKMQIFSPRQSYLQYLPAVYREDPVSREFLERFLSLFESVFSDLEAQIDRLFRYFDPDDTPAEFLPWLSSWLDLSQQESWPEAIRRRFLKSAALLYKKKGTVEGLSGIIRLLTGAGPIIIEPGRSGKPMVLGGNFHLGVDSLLLGTPLRGFRLGDDSILGRVLLRHEVQEPENPFLPMANRFTVIVNLGAEEFARYEKSIRFLLKEEKPAHTEFSLRNLPQSLIGIGSYIGIGLRVGGFRPLQIGSETALGTGILSAGAENGGRIGISEKTGGSTRLE